MFRIGLPGDGSLDELDTRPDAARILPAAAGATDPLSEDCSCEDDAALAFLELAGERCGLSGGAHAGADEGGEEIGGNGKPRAFRDIVHTGDELDTETGADEFFQVALPASDRSPRYPEAPRRWR